MIIYKVGEKKKIAAWLNIKASFLANICARRRGLSLDKAIRLKIISGISCENWRFLSGELLEEKIYRAWREKGK